MINRKLNTQISIKELLKEKLNIKEYRRHRFPDFGFDDFLNLENN
jgi:hypothetical protein